MDLMATSWIQPENRADNAITNIVSGLIIRVACIAGNLPGISKKEMKNLNVHPND